MYVVNGREPSVAGDSRIAFNAVLIGSVRVGPLSSVWFNAVLRADQETITIGSGTNVQDCAVLHADPGLPLLVGDRVSIGHGAVVHGCGIGDDVLVGMGATVLNGARVGAGSIIAAGAVVLEDAEVPPRSLVAGVPGRVRRATTEDEVDDVIRNSIDYQHLAGRYPVEMLFEGGAK